MKTTITATILIAAMLVSWGMLSFYATSKAAADGASQPFGNAVEQRNEIIRELREIKNLLKEQNAILRASSKDTTSSAARGTP